MKTTGPYEPHRFLGAGSFGGVWECQHVTTGESVACKIIDINTAISDKVYPHFRNEMLIHSKINHPSITQLKDVILDKQNIYIFLELCDGGDLNDIVQEVGGLTEDEAKHYFHQIMEALQYIHKLGVAHRDVKLENILVTADDDAKLTDFGLCKQQNGNDPMIFRINSKTYACIYPQTANRVTLPIKNQNQTFTCILFFFITNIHNRLTFRINFI